MARKVRDTRLETRDARAVLKRKHEPYWRQIEPGLFLGYRKGARGGVWFVRRLVNGTYKYEKLGRANDNVDSNDIDVLDYSEAQRKAIGVSDTSARSEARGAKPDYTVNDALDDYMLWYQDNRKSYSVTKLSADKHIKLKLGHRKISTLTTPELRRWLAGVAKGRSKATANRVFNILRAVLNRAWEDGMVAEADAWRRVKPFKGADKSRAHWLTVADCKRLLAACESDFRDIVRGALVTGCRHGELLAMRVKHYDKSNATVVIEDSKTGDVRHVSLGDEGVALFDALTKGRERGEPVFRRADGQPWGKTQQTRRMRDACIAAKIDPPVPFHSLRHTFASLLIKNDVPMAYVADALGHEGTRMVEKHYGHLAPSHVATTIRKKLPKFGST